MPNLIVEYLKRKNSTAIPVQHDGICFFEAPYALPVIAMTSLTCRSFMTCSVCETKKTPIIELFQPGYNGSFNIISHTHVDPCTDLNKFVTSTPAYFNHKPFYAKKPRDLEVWLWKFCTQTLKVARSALVEKDLEMRALEEMAAAAIKHPKTYNVYFLAYEAFLLSRKYLLYG